MTNKELDRVLVGKTVKPIRPQEKSYLPKWLYTHKCRYEIMDNKYGKNQYVVRSIKDRTKFWYVAPSELEIIETQLSLFDMEVTK